MLTRSNSREGSIYNARRAEAFEREVSDALTTLGFKLTHRLAVDKAPAISLQAARARRGRRPTRYGLELKLIIDGKAAAEALQRFRRSTEEGEDYDEYWLIGLQVSMAARVAFDEASTRYRVFTLAELTTELRPPVRPRPKKTRTKVGKSVLANQANILLTVAAIIQLIAEKIEVTKSERPNSHEGIALRDATIVDLQNLREQVSILGNAVTSFVGGQKKESETVTSVNNFADGVQAWWKKGHDQILYSAFGTSIFTLSVSVCSLAGVSMHGKTVAIVAGALAGGKPLVDALRGLGKNLFK